MLRPLHRCASVLHRTYCSVVSVFNQRPPSPSRRLLGLRGNSTGLFGFPELTSSSGFRVLRQEAEEKAADLLKEALSPQRSRRLVAVFDELSDTLCRVADMADCMRVLHPDIQYRKEAEEVCSAIMRLVEELNTNADLYAALKAVVDAGGELEFETDDVDRRVAELLLADFELSGIHLDAETRRRFVEENERAFSIGAYFMQACGVPRRLKKSLVANSLHGDMSLFSVNDDEESFHVSSALSNSSSAVVREMAYRVFYFPDPHQEELLRALLETRHNLATLTGFEKFSDRATRHTMAASADNVMTFLQQLHERIPLDEELSLLRFLKQELIPGNGDGEELRMWDLPFLVRQARQRLLTVPPDALAAHFSLGGCMEALRSLCVDLFDVTFRVATPAPGELWHSDVFKAEFEQRDEGPLGTVYLDLFARPGKPEHDCHYTIRGGRQTVDGYQHPAVTLHLNLTRPSGSTPCLLGVSEVENLFHEFGHALHSILGRTRYQHVTGTRTSTDFAEVPSTLMERFAMDPRLLERYAIHHRTGERLDAATIGKLQTSRDVLVGVEVKQHVMYAALDQILHGPQPLPGSPSEVMRAIHNSYYPVPYVDKTAWHHRFSHLVGYGAKYYSYLMARAVAHRLWTRCFAADPFSREWGERYRRQMLAFGGERAPGELFHNLTGEELTSETMATGLVESVRPGVGKMERKILTGL